MAKNTAFTEAGLFRSYWDDGLLDALAGLWVLLTGIGWLAGLNGLAGVHAPMWLLLWRPLRQQIVEPRAGFVRFSQSRRERSSHNLWLVLAIGVGILALVAGLLLVVGKTGPEDPATRLAGGLPALLVAVPATITGFLTGAGRFHVYAAILVAAAVLTAHLGLDPAPSLIAGGALIVTTGAVLLARFISARRTVTGGPGA